MKYLTLKLIILISLIASCGNVDNTSKINSYTQCGFADNQICDSKIKDLDTDNIRFYNGISGSSLKSAWLSSGFINTGIKVKLMRSNLESWYARWKMISEAQYKVDLSYLIVETDVFGESLISLLHYKILNHGIKVRFIMDSFNSNDFMTGKGRDLVDELYHAAKTYNDWAKSQGRPQTASVEVKGFNPKKNIIIHAFDELLSSLSSKNYIKRVISFTHDKLILVDDKYLIAGGRNLAKKYFAEQSDYAAAFSDTDVFVESDTLGQRVKRAFEAEFYLDKNKTLGEAINLQSRRIYLLTMYEAMTARLMETNFPMSDPTGQINDQLWIADMNKHIPRLAKYKTLGHHEQKHLQEYVNGTFRSKRVDYKTYEYFKGMAYPSRSYAIWDKTSNITDNGYDQITPNLIRMINATEKEIIFQNPYVIFDKDIWNALLNACKRNVSIILHTNSPKSTDLLITQAWFMKEWVQRMVDNPCMRTFAFDGVRSLHAKVFVFDRTVVAVGSHNLDPLAQEVGSEILFASYNKQFAGNTALQILFYDMIDPTSGTIEYKIRKNAEGNWEGIPGHRPEDFLQQIEKQKAFKIFQFLTNFEGLRDFS